MIVTRPSGTTQIYLGRTAPPSGIPAWVTSMSSRTWTQLSAPTFLAGANSVITPGAYRGTNPIGAIVDAYGDPVLDPVTKKVYFQGGGHGDGSCNAMPAFDLATLSYFLENSATPPSTYPPSFFVTITPGVGYTYPSGLAIGWHRTLAQLSDPADQPYAAPISKPFPLHRYGGQAVRTKSGQPKEIHYFYGQPRRYLLDTHEWSLDHEIIPSSWLQDAVCDRADIQTPGLGNNLVRGGNLTQGTMCVYDEVTDKFLVTLIGGGWRYGLFLWDPATQSCPWMVANTGAGFQILESAPMVQAGRWCYIFSSNYLLPYTQRVIDRGVRFNFDTRAIEYFTLTGVSLSYNLNSNQECAPAWYSPDTNKIAFWNHTSSDKQNIYELDVGAITSGGGTGSIGSPYSWSMTKSAMAGTPPGIIGYKYNGVMQIPDWGVAVVFPHSTVAPFAIKI